jgi:poly-gamma-glutamate capsule biosynthesis protein CapA/YwtB (metallophosphatase superfamily)
MTAALLCLFITQTPGRVTLMFGGDVIPHDPVKHTAAQRARTDGEGNNAGWDHVLGALAPAFAQADVAVVNLETPIISSSKPEGGPKIFSAPPSLLGALKRTGVDVATFANNHCLDQHREGITSTRAAIEQAQLRSAGAAQRLDLAWAPLVLEKNGLRIGLLAVTRWLNGFHNTLDPSLPHVPLVPYPADPVAGGVSVDDFLALIRARATEVDALVVSIHWGNEYQTEPTTEDRALAKQMLDAGAFAIIGHHPHVLQPVEYVERSAGGTGLVVFSLGNLVSNQDSDDPQSTKRDGVLVELELVKDGAGPVRLAGVKGIAVATENHVGPGAQRNVQAVLLDDELSAIDERLVELAGRGGQKVVLERRALEARRETALLRRARIFRVLPRVVGPAPLAQGRVRGESLQRK